MIKAVTIDGISINATHFGAMTEPEAVTRMIADGFVPGGSDDEKKVWAKKAYGLAKEALAPKAEAAKPAPAK